MSDYDHPLFMCSICNCDDQWREENCPRGPLPFSVTGGSEATADRQDPGANKVGRVEESEGATAPEARCEVCGGEAFPPWVMADADWPEDEFGQKQVCLRCAYPVLSRRGEPLLVRVADDEHDARDFIAAVGRSASTDDCSQSSPKPCSGCPDLADDVEIVREALEIANDYDGCYYNLPFAALDRVSASAAAAVAARDTARQERDEAILATCICPYLAERPGPQRRDRSCPIHGDHIHHAV